MKVYNIDLTFQPLGSQFLMVMRGTEEDMELAYNGFYNFGGTASHMRYKKDPDTGLMITCGGKEGSHLDYGTHNRNVATFFSTAEKMHKFFFNKAFHKHVDNWPKKKRGQNSGGIFPFCQQYADSAMVELESSKEMFYHPQLSSRSLEHIYSVGTVAAERPDDDFRDAVVKKSFGASEKTVSASEKDIDNSEELE